MKLSGSAPVSDCNTSATDIWPGWPGPERLPAVDTIPNPFRFFNPANNPSGNGYVSSPEEWSARRSEIKELVQRYWLGYRWPTEAKDVIGASEEVIEPNTVWVGFDFPPYAVPTKIDIHEAFGQLTAELRKGEVVVRELLPPVGPFAPPSLGDIRASFGPADSEADAQALAFEAWNAGYSVPYMSFGKTYYAVLRDYTGLLSVPPPATKPFMHHTVTIMNPDNGEQASFRLTVHVPSGAQTANAWGRADASVPVVLDIGGTIAQVAELNAQGFAYIRLRPADIYPDAASTASGTNRDGVYTRLYPYNKDVYEYASGALMAWGWGVSQIINALEQPARGSSATWGDQLRIDPSKTLVTGHSRFGKAAMFAAAFDERIGITLASEPGGSGIQSFRYKVEGKIFNFNTYPKADRVYGKTETPTVSYGSGSSWFPETAARFVNQDNRLPFDSSDLIALIAPRPFFATTGIDSHWLGNEGAVAAMQAASEVYAFIGKDEIERTNIAVRARESDHILYPRDLTFAIAIMDREYKQGSDDRSLHVRDLFPDGNGSLGSMSYPARDYDGISDMNDYPFDINSSYMPWSRPDKYALWTAQENFLVGHPVSITAHSDSPDVKLVLPDGTEVQAAGKDDGGVFRFNLTADQSVYGRYELRTAGGAKLNRSVFFAAVSLADALRHATSKGDEGEENRLLGFSSRLSNTAANPPEVVVDGERVTMSFTPERFKAEETTLLEYGILFHDALFARIANEGWDESKTFHIRNLQFVTIPGYTFELTFGNIPASAGNNGKDLAQQFKQPISWNVERFNNGPADVWPAIPDTKAEKDALQSGGTVERPDRPAPKATAFYAEIVSTKLQRAGDKTEVVIAFDMKMDTREFGIGLNIGGSWETSWSADRKQVTLSMAAAQFPPGRRADMIIFRLLDADRNMIPGPLSISFMHQG